MPTLKDIQGRDIEIGHKIAWPSRRGAQMWLNYGVVFDIIAYKDYAGSHFAIDVRIDGPREKDRLTRLTQLGTIAVIG